MIKSEIQAKINQIWDDPEYWQSLVSFPWALGFVSRIRSDILPLVPGLKLNGYFHLPKENFTQTEELINWGKFFGFREEDLLFNPDLGETKGLQKEEDILICDSPFDLVKWRDAQWAICIGRSYNLRASDPGWWGVGLTIGNHYKN